MLKIITGRNLINVKFEIELNKFLDILKRLYNQIDKTNIRKIRVMKHLVFVLTTKKNKKLNIKKIKAGFSKSLV